MNKIKKNKAYDQIYVHLSVPDYSLYADVQTYEDNIKCHHVHSGHLRPGTVLHHPLNNSSEDHQTLEPGECCL